MSTLTPISAVIAGATLVAATATLVGTSTSTAPQAIATKDVSFTLTPATAPQPAPSIEDLAKADVSAPILPTVSPKVPSAVKPVPVRTDVEAAKLAARRASVLDALGRLQTPPPPKECFSPYPDREFPCYSPKTDRIQDPSGSYQDVTAQFIDDVSSYFHDRYRAEVVHTAVHQLNVDKARVPGWVGLCQDEAVQYYDAEGAFGKNLPWCTEFVRSVYCWSGLQNVMDLCRAGEVGDMKRVFSSGSTLTPMWLTHANLQAADAGFSYSAQTGDYLTKKNGEGEHFAHSTIIVGISADNRYVWTIEGNNQSGNDKYDNSKHCVRFVRRDWFVGDVWNEDLDAVGRIAHISPLDDEDVGVIRQP